MKKKILIVRFSAMGDLILATGPIAQLRSHCANTTIDLLTSEIGAELFNNSIDIDHTIIVPKGSGLWSLVKIYQMMESYDVVIDLQGNFKSHFLKLFQWADFYHIEKQSKERRAFAKKRKYKNELQKHVVEKYFATIKKAYPDLSDVDLEEIRPRFPSLNIHFHPDEFDIKRAVAIHPYASQKNKEWPHFKKLINELVKQEKTVIIVGSSESELEVEKSKNILNLTNQTSIREMAAIIDKAQSFITTDSGPMHMAVALKKPTVALFGPTTKEFGFYPDFKNVKVIEEEMDCRPCHVHGGDECPLTHHNCMKNISVERVLSELKSITQ